MCFLSFDELKDAAWQGLGGGASEGEPGSLMTHQLIEGRGVKHGKLTVTTTGEDIG